MDVLYIARNMAPPAALLDGILVNRQGRRFVPEDAYTGNVGDSIARQPEQMAWLILPATSLLRALKECVTCGWHNFKFFGLPAMANIFLGGTKFAFSIAAAARSCKIAHGTLLETCRSHDADLSNGVPDRHGFTSAARARIGNGPFFIINMALSNRHAFTPYMTLGGLLVDEVTGTVLRRRHSRAGPVCGGPVRRWLAFRWIYQRHFARGWGVFRPARGPELCRRERKEEGRCSFLKKRPKKLLLLRRFSRGASWRRSRPDRPERKRLAMRGTHQRRETAQFARYPRAP
jgi:hypothetical protein